MNEIVPATLEHAEALAPRLRRDDVNEVRASSGEAPLDVLTFSVALSPKSWAYLRDGVVMGIFGVAPFPGKPGVGVPWLLCAEGVEQRPVYFIRACRKYLAEMLAEFPYLTNYIDCRNTVSIQWLAYLGFALCEVEPFYGAMRLPFIRFAISRRTPECASP